MFLLLYQGLQIKTWRGNNPAVSRHSIAKSIMLEGKFCRIFEGFKTMKLEETALKECEWEKNKRADWLQGSAPQSP